MKRIIVLLVGLIVFASGCSLAPGANNTISPNINSSTTNYLNPAVVPDNILDLSYKGLTKVDMSIFDKVYLEELNLSNNNLTGALPSQVGQLKNLRVLNVSNNQMTGVPAEVGQLSKLEILDLSNNQLTGLPNELANLKKLKTLNLSGNQYSEQDLSVIRNSLPNVQYILK